MTIAAVPERAPGRHEAAHRRRVDLLRRLRAGDGYAGFGVCPKCGRTEYLRGLTYEGKRCAACIVNP